MTVEMAAQRRQDLMRIGADHETKLAIGNGAGRDGVDRPIGIAGLEGQDLEAVPAEHALDRRQRLLPPFRIDGGRALAGIDMGGQPALVFAAAHPDRIGKLIVMNSLVFGVFAAVALVIAVVGVAGVLAFSVSSRTREFGIRLALGSEPQRLLRGVIAEGAVMAALGILAGAAFGFVVARLAGSFFIEMKMPSALPVVISALLLMTVAVVASLLPAARAARVDVMEALRSE